MLHTLITFHKNNLVDFLLKLLLSVVLLCLLGPIVVKMKGEMPITLQSFVVLLVAIAWGWRVGFTACIIYLLCGMFGLPVLAGYTSGVDKQVFLGFYFGFLFAAVLTGYFAEKKMARNPLWNLALWLGGHAVVLLFGAIWLMRMNPDGWWEMIQSALPGAAIKSVVGALLMRIIMRMRMTREEFYAG